MGRAPRLTVAGLVYHLLNRRVMRLPLFEKDGDYEAFERVLAAALSRPDAPKLLAYCLMPNHWHLAVQAGPATNLSTWMQWVTVTHTHRWHTHRGVVGEGPLYQGRFKSFPVQHDQHLLMMCRYVEANAKRGGLVERAELWRWCSLWLREAPARSRTGVDPAVRAMISDWPLQRPRSWLALVNQLMNPTELERVRLSIARGRPFGSEAWTDRVITKLGLTTTTRPRGRPRKKVSG